MEESTREEWNEAQIHKANILSQDLMKVNMDHFNFASGDYLQPSHKSTVRSGHWSHHEENASERADSKRQRQRRKRNREWEYDGNHYNPAEVSQHPITEEISTMDLPLDPSLAPQSRRQLSADDGPRELLTGTSAAFLHNHRAGPCDPDPFNQEPDSNPQQSLPGQANKKRRRKNKVRFLDTNEGDVIGDQPEMNADELNRHLTPEPRDEGDEWWLGDESQGHLRQAMDTTNDELQRSCQIEVEKRRRFTINNLDGRITMIEKAMEHESDRQRRLQQTMDWWEAKGQSVQDEMRDLREKVAIAEGQVQTCTSEKTDLRHQIETLERSRTTEQASWRDNNEDLLKSNRELSVAKRKLLDELRRMVDERDEALQEIEVLQPLNDSLSAKVTRAKEEVARLQLALAESTDRFEKVTASMTARNSEMRSEKRNSGRTKRDTERSNTDRRAIGDRYNLRHQQSSAVQQNSPL